MSSRLYERVEEIRGYKYIRLKGQGRKPGRLIGFWDAMRAAEAAHTDLGRAVSRVFKLAADDWDLERLESFVWNLESDIAAIRKEIERRQGVKTQRERIAALRLTTGRSPEEAAIFHAKADELEARLHDAR